MVQYMIEKNNIVDNKYSIVVVDDDERILIII